MAPEADGLPTLRPENTREVIEALLLVRSAEPVLRDELVQRTGLARATVGKAVARLNRDREKIVDVKTNPGSGRTEFVSLNANAGYAVAIQLGHRRVTAAVGDLWGRIVSRDHWARKPCDPQSNPRAALDIAADLVREILGRSSIGAREIIGVGIGLAGPVDPELGMVRALTGDGGSARVDWLGLKPASALRERLSELDCPFVVGNDANLAALEEYRAAQQTANGRGRIRDLIYLRWSSGIGTGIVLDGRVHMGRRGLAGELGHVPITVPIDPSRRPARPCSRCGNETCLENVASYDAMKRHLHLPEDLANADFELNVKSKQEIRAAATLIGQALSPLVSTLTPQAILIGGPQQKNASLIEEHILTGLQKSAPASALGDLDVRLVKSRWGSIGDDRGRLVVCSGVIHHVLDREAANYLVQRVHPAKPASHISERVERESVSVR